MGITFRFDPEKAVEAAAMFLELHGKPMKYIGLLKLLYLADRLSLERMEHPITGDCGASLDWGLLPSNIYNLIKGKTVGRALPLWKEFISDFDADKKVSLKAVPEYDNLCEAEEDIIREVYEKNGKIDPFDLAMGTHALPEWENPHGSSIFVNVDKVLRYMGKSESDIENIRQDVDREAYLDKVLAT